MLDRAERIGADSETDATAERIAQKRDVAKVRQVAPLCFNVRVAYEMTNEATLACEFALARHVQTWT